MRVPKTTLVMAGAREAHGIVTALLSRRRRVIASLAATERMFGALPVKTRVGFFKDDNEFQFWVISQDVATVIDASHAFDDHISRMVSGVCRRCDIRYLRVLRPAWQATALDRWQPYPSIKKAASAMPKNSRVFTNTGWLTLPEYAQFSGAALFMRQTHPESSPPPFEFVTFVEGEPPFSQFQEQRLFSTLRISHLICRNVGGAASMSKLLAARALEIPVSMIQRAPLPTDLPVVETIAEALAWEANQ